MKYIQSIGIALIITIAATGSACKSRKTTTDACSGTTYTFTKDVQPIINNACASTCHSAAKNAGGIDLSTYEKVKSEAAMPRFMGAIRHLAGYSPMPKKNPKLSDSLIQVLNCWKEKGFAQ